MPGLRNAAATVEMAGMSNLRTRLRPPIFQAAQTPDESFRLIEVHGGYSGCGWHFHPEMQIGHVVRGSGERAVGDSLHAIEEGEVILLGPNLPHVWRYDPAPPSANIEAVAIHFRADFLGAGFLDAPELRDVRLLLARACQGLQFVGLTRSLLSEQVLSLRALSGLDRLMGLLGILNTMARSREVLTLSSSLLQPVAAELEQQRLKRVCDYIVAHYHASLDRDAVADVACLSPSSFSRFFKSHTGVTFHDYVADVRVGQACQWLLDPQAPVTEIAHRCGFADLSTFNRTFRKLRHMSPTEYRRRMNELSNIGRPRRQ